MTQPKTLLVFLKYPEAGKVKTRLAARVGAERAAEIYRGWIGDILSDLQPLRPEFRLLGCVDGAEPDAFSPWSSFVDDWWRQPAGDLGVRLDDGFRKAHERGGIVIAIGADCLDVDPPLIRSAALKLNSVDVVVGPAGDGGYYLVGSARYLGGLFDRVRWSSRYTLDDQIRRCRQGGWSFGLLPTRNDIDTWKDWLEHCERRGRKP
jgi:rSAM/selenodomain-associated transferase 1